MMTDSRKLVSINITTYNRAHLLPRCLDSVLKQRYPNMEVVVVDDCSSDDTQQVMDVYQKKDVRVKYIRHAVNKGNAYARNTALQNCRGYYVAFMDDDDEWIDEQKISKQVQIFEEARHKLGIVCSGVKIINQKGKELIKAAKRPDALISVLLEGNGIIHNSTVLTRKEIMEEAGGFDTNLRRGIDSDFYRNCVVRLGYDVHFMPDITAVYYEDNPDRITLKKNAAAHFQVARNQVYVIKKYFPYFLKYRRSLFCRIELYLKSTARYLSGVCLERLHKTKLYQIIRSVYRGVRWRTYYRKRTIREYLQRYKAYPDTNKRSNVVFMTGMPRTGSSLMKNFFGTHPALKVMPFQPKGFYESWKLSFQEEKMLIDKSTHYIRHLEKIIATCKDQAFICCIIRDPRAQLCSLFEFDRHPETSRGKKFWKQWYEQYQHFLDQTRKYPNVNFFLLRYEDLVKQPEKAKTAFLDWLGLEANLVNNRYEITNQQDIQDPKVFKKRSVSQESLSRWKEIEDPRHREILMAYEKMEAVKNLMTSFGYLPELGSMQLAVSSNVKFFQVDAYEEQSI